MKKTFREITKDIDMVLFNNIIKVDYELELEEWSDFDLYSDLYSKKSFEEEKQNWNIPKDAGFNDESEEYKDIYQYFAINYSGWEYIARKTKMPLFYSSKFDLYILWIDFLDNWSNLSYEV